MKAKRNTILDRYEHTSDGKIIIDVRVFAIEHLYDNFDNTASYLKKDLDGDFADYLLDCINEIDSQPFIIRISLEQPSGQDKKRRLRKSIRNYFSYLRDVERGAMRQFYRRLIALFGLGLTLIFLSLQLRPDLGGTASVLRTLAGEGVTIAAWVTLWEVFADIIVNWYPQHKKVVHCSRLADAPVVFEQLELAVAV
jgi:hypothetical protein